MPMPISCNFVSVSLMCESYHIMEIHNLLMKCWQFVDPIYAILEIGPHTLTYPCRSYNCAFFVLQAEVKVAEHPQEDWKIL